MQQSELEIVENGKASSPITGQEQIVTSSFFPTVLDRLIHSLDYIAILRPLLLIPGWTMLLLGYYKGLGGESAGQHSFLLIGNMHIILRPDSDLLITLLLYSLLMGAGYILNQLSDSRTDEINSKLYLVAQGHIRKSNLKIQIGILLSFSIIMAFLKFTLTYAFLVALSFALVSLYSVPPVRLKGRPILDLLANASGFGFVAFAVGWLSKSSFSMDLVLSCIPYAICISAAFINTTIPDIKGDIQNGDISTGAFLGIRNSCIMSTILVGAVPFISLFLRDYICLTASILSLPFFIYMTVSNWDDRSPKIRTIILATKVSLLVLSILIAVFIPLYFALLVFTILLMKVYYQIRFGISYP